MSMPAERALHLWTVDEVASWLGAAVPGAGAYVDTFRQQQIDGAALVSLDERDLRDALGVAELGTRRAIVRAAAYLGGQGGSSPGACAPPAAACTMQLRRSPPLASPPRSSTDRNAYGGSLRPAEPLSQTPPPRQQSAPRDAHSSVVVALVPPPREPPAARNDTTAARAHPHLARSRHPHARQARSPPPRAWAALPTSAASFAPAHRAPASPEAGTALQPLAGRHRPVGAAPVAWGGCSAPAAAPMRATSPLRSEPLVAPRRRPRPAAAAPDPEAPPPVLATPFPRSAARAPAAPGSGGPVLGTPLWSRRPQPSGVESPTTAAALAALHRCAAASASGPSSPSSPVKSVSPQRAAEVVTVLRKGQQERRPQAGAVPASPLPQQQQQQQQLPPQPAQQQPPPVVVTIAMRPREQAQPDGGGATGSPAQQPLPAAPPASPVHEVAGRSGPAAAAADYDCEPLSLPRRGASSRPPAPSSPAAAAAPLRKGPAPAESPRWAAGRRTLSPPQGTRGAPSASPTRALAVANGARSPPGGLTLRAAQRALRRGADIPPHELRRLLLSVDADTPMHSKPCTTSPPSVSPRAAAEGASPAAQQAPILIECSGCRRRAMIYPVAGSSWCATCGSERDWRFIGASGEAGTPPAPTHHVEVLATAEQTPLAV
eukprot:TRINITY_DN5794_c0_g1_i4.p1 TRINITY_DN5794_c0_g1~~TRINITY_DN5794_c0_g1_i4.p1  ORF type:complete len:660 (+),score=107.60 TRINITY_DN5794_c0_g1_i4:64-2043(+)